MSPPRGARLAAGATAAALVGLACVLPACAHDARSGAGWTVSTNNERNFFLGNNPYTPDYKTSHLGQRSLEELDPEARTYLESFYARSDQRAAMQHAAIDYMVHHPARTSLRTLNRATSFWGFDYLASREIQNWRGWSAARTLPLLALEGASYLAVAAMALVTLFAHARRRPAAVAVVAGRARPRVRAALCDRVLGGHVPLPGGASARPARRRRADATRTSVALACARAAPPGSLWASSPSSKRSTRTTR